MRGFSEKLPAYTVGNTAFAARTVKQLTANVALRMDFTPTAGGVMPYLTVGADFNSFDDGLGNNSDYVSPRVAAGFSVDSGSGTLSVDVDGGEILDGTTDIGVSVLYRMNF